MAICDSLNKWTNPYIDPQTLPISVPPENWPKNHLRLRAILIDAILLGATSLTALLATSASIPLAVIATLTSTVALGALCFLTNYKTKAAVHTICRGKEDRFFDLVGNPVDSHMIMATFANGEWHYYRNLREGSCSLAFQGNRQELPPQPVTTLKRKKIKFTAGHFEEMDGRIIPDINIAWQQGSFWHAQGARGDLPIEGIEVVMPEQKS